MASKRGKTKSSRKKARAPRATFVFLNCNRLDFLPTQQLPSQRIQNLAATLRAAANNKAPEVFGLCEVHDIVLARELAENVAPNTYDVIVSTPPTQTMGAMGLALCFDTSLFACVDVVRDRPRRPKVNSRSYWMATQLQFQMGQKACLWIVLNHWKSWLEGEMETELTRLENFREMEELFRTTSDLRGQTGVMTPVPPLIRTDDFVLIAGDFNCEPGSRPLCFPTRAEGIEVRRHLGSVTGIRRNRALFLNTMWTAMGKDDPNQPKFLHGTYNQGTSNYGPRMFDQILVSQALLESGSLVQYVPGSTLIRKTKGLASDHSAVAATLVY